MFFTKEDFIKRLRENKMYQNALASVDKEQAARIASYVEGWLGAAADGLVPAFSMVSSADKESMTKASQTLDEQTRLLKDSGPVLSGSRE